VINGGGLATDHTVFVIDLASRRAHILGSTPHPHELFMRPVGSQADADAVAGANAKAHAECFVGPSNMNVSIA